MKYQKGVIGPAMAALLTVIGLTVTVAPHPELTADATPSVKVVGTTNAVTK